MASVSCVKPAGAFAVIALTVLLAQLHFAVAAPSEPKRFRGQQHDLATESTNESKHLGPAPHAAVQHHGQGGSKVGTKSNTSEPRNAGSKVHGPVGTIFPDIEQALGSNDTMYGGFAAMALELVPVRILARLGSVGNANQVPQSQTAGTTSVDPSHAKFSLAGFLVQALFVLLFAFIYQSKKTGIMDFIALKQTPHDKLLLEKRGFAFGLFNCCDEPKLCLLSCCCGAVRWADTMRMMGFFLTLLGAVATYLCCSLVGNLMPGGFLLLLLMQVYYRQQMRTEFKMPSGTCMTCFEDCLTYCFCSPCAITQEARQAELAARVGYPTVVA